MKRSIRDSLTVAGVALVFVSVMQGPAFAASRSECMTQCQQQWDQQDASCQANHRNQMVQCGNLPTNQERSQCKKNANDVLNKCREQARRQAKACKQGCPPK